MEIDGFDLADIRAWAVELTTEAAQRALVLLESGTRSYFKADGTIVTDVDRTTERFLREAILKRFPTHTILGEEYGLEGHDTRAPLWAIDPVDGTVNLANGLPFWCVSVGLIANDTPVVGVIVAPLLALTFSAALGQGATLNGKPLDPLTSGGSLTWEDAYGICSTSARTVDFSEVPCRLRVIGSAALELAWTSAGMLKGCQSIGTSLYDVAAGMCLCRETGAVSAWHQEGDWAASRMLAGDGKTDILLTAPPATLDFIRERIEPGI